jgi:hypothetical protein
VPESRESKWKSLDDVQSGDSLQGGVAVHYTHNYDQMVGLEVDGSAVSKTQTNGVDTANTGRTNVFANAVAHWPSRPVLGGNFSIRGLVGVPLYERGNGLQLGEAYHASLAVNWQRRF